MTADELGSMLVTTVIKINIDSNTATEKDNFSPDSLGMMNVNISKTTRNAIGIIILNM